ncbi:HutD family protein [Arthrobacter sp. H5]|uniref:HutD/Ves family protein n=1 Tax=Arthrobacter sp. H5 TaxID=1267973 RepID=UPI0004865BA7|nr:HutD family protein [Arthrobacter sp. H5]
MDILPAAGHRRIPWLNGQGYTTEVFVSPGLDGLFEWRLSIATIDSDAEFSQFPGVDRTLMALSPQGLDLLDEAHPVRLDQFAIHSFAGENRVSSINVSQPTLDLNLMTRRGRCHGTMVSRTVAGAWTVAADDGGQAAVVLLQGTVHCGGVGLGLYDAVVVGAGTRMELEGDGVVALMMITR